MKKSLTLYTYHKRGANPETFSTVNYAVGFCKPTDCLGKIYNTREVTGGTIVDFHKSTDVKD